MATRALEVQYNPMPNGGFAATCTDIPSACKAAEQACATAETRMRLITDALPALIAYVDRFTCFTSLVSIPSIPFHSIPAHRIARTMDGSINHSGINPLQSVMNRHQSSDKPSDIIG